jgi:DNA-binding CsgD family transcriptional regulator
MADDVWNKINKNLEVLIALSAQHRPQPGANATVREQIAKLAECGLAPADIARILGKKRETVNAEIGKIRKTVPKNDQLEPKNGQ